ncbi:peptidyl-prolyl cis-trans isomerase FKBP15-3-like [Hibiscus syriacus]|uniref:peptidyl-prolyl cis-trans isomerase FKBP15-3-like n=1 Tax=Hibiscus syriacus TaxID=106335 RepID=UPI001921AE58|nr:peptidyl-prolyl cis-trans isomerase FKBP15-3-like [Hibiscus syriacus]
MHLWRIRKPKLMLMIIILRRGKRRKGARMRESRMVRRWNHQPPEKEQSVDLNGKNTNDQEIQLSNGIMIEELEKGKPNGKIASLGKKVRVHYTVKLKDSGEVIDSSADKGHLTFRLVEGQAQETWKVGIDGMQVGGKRRLTVPPWVSTKEGRGENIPPNSWLVFEVELVKVR